MLALVDVNNMYVSCERVFRPWLNGRPVVVLSHNDGVCIARSNEAKDLGVEMAQPWFQVRHLQRSAGLIALSANFELYGDMSNRMMTLAARYAPRQEIYSIDECFLDFAGVRGDLVRIGRALRAQVLQWTGLPTSVGIAMTKTLAKLANHVAKTADRMPGSYGRELAQVCHFGALSEDQLAAVMQATEVGAVWGIGRKTSARLHHGGIHSVLDAVRADAAALRRQFSIVLEKTLRELRGEPCIDVDDLPAANQQIMCSRTFGEPVASLASLTDSVSAFASRAAEKLRSQRGVARAVHVFLSTSPHRRHDRQHSPSATLPLARPTADTRLLAAAAQRALAAMYRPGFNYVRAGVVLVDLQPQAHAPDQPELFDAETVQPGRDRARLMVALDTLNQRFGRGAVEVASAVRRARAGAAVTGDAVRSPRYTTRLDELITARA
ncbi:MAG TPA: DUF4113 domain-containing protein [Burkholderiaceae bacterium]|nr:DUF4113 domain-containing protein [Burkholderiaceae bacterium]